MDHISKNIITPIIVAVIVGLGSSFFMGTALISKMEVDLVRAKEDIKTNTIEIKAMGKQREHDREAFVRLESKIDMLILEQRRLQKENR